MKKIYFLAYFVSIIAGKSYSQVPDWSTNIASIIYDHCSLCHHEGAIGPFPLMSYADAVNNSFSIQTQVNAKKMPPWPPDPNYNHLKDENVLSDNELNEINDWIDNGMPSGDLSLAPPSPVFLSGSQMIDPDDSIQLPVFEIPFEPDVYWNFVQHSGYTETKYINSIELIKANLAAIHHSQIQYDSSDFSNQDDLNYPGLGYPQSVATSPYIEFFGADQVHMLTLPHNMGYAIPAGSDYVTYLHYTPSEPGLYDSSRINIKFCKDSIVRVVNSVLMLYNTPPSLLDGPFEIPANTVKTFHFASGKFFDDKSLLGLGVHAHQVCKSWEVFMVTFINDTIPLLKIPNWDFRWQGGYLLTKVIKIPFGAQIFGNATFDNTSNNPNNPNNPPKDVKGGTSSFDEMARARLIMTDYQAGDEDIILDSAFYNATNIATQENKNYLRVFPNPVSDYVYVTCEGNEDEIEFSLYNSLGEVIFMNEKRSVKENGYIFNFDCSTYSPGMYLLEARSGAESCTSTFIIERKK